MNTDEKMIASTDAVDDNLEDVINGLGETYAEVLKKIGIDRPDDLAKYDTPAELRQALEKAGEKIQSGRIEKNDWLGQAKDRVLTQQASVKLPLSNETADVEQEPNKSSSEEEWEQHAGFNLFFDSKKDEQDKKEWLTRVYYFAEPNDDFDAKDEFSGIETNSWVNWILKHAELPVDVSPSPDEPEVATKSNLAEAETAVLPEPLAPEGIRIDIPAVELPKVEPPPGTYVENLKVEVHFKLSGTEVEALTENHIPFCTEVYTVDMESKASHLVASGQDQLQPHMFEYTSQQEFPVPEVGYYQVYGIVRLPPPYAGMACRQTRRNLKVAPLVY